MKLHYAMYSMQHHYLAWTTGFPVGFCAAEGSKSDRDWEGGGGGMWGRGGVASFRGVDSVPLKGPQEIRDTFIIRS